MTEWNFEQGFARMIRWGTYDLLRSHGGLLLDLGCNAYSSRLQSVGLMCSCFELTADDMTCPVLAPGSPELRPDRFFCLVSMVHYATVKSPIDLNESTFPPALLFGGK